jgi:hypothetical protein
MRDLLLLAVQLIITLAKLARPGGVRSVIVRGKPPQARSEGSNAGNHRGNRPDEAS